MCYHLVLLQKGLGNDLSFFTKVKRQGVYPFLKYEKRDQENGDNSQKNKTCVAFSNSNGKLSKDFIDLIIIILLIFSFFFYL
jgi:hypothetical protein